MADKIYEKFFNSDEIQADISDVYHYKPQLLKMVWGMELVEHQKINSLLFSKKIEIHQKTKKILKVMDQMVYRQFNIISASLAGTDANGVVDLSQILDDEISILK